MDLRCWKTRASSVTIFGFNALRCDTLRIFEYCATASGVECEFALLNEYFLISGERRGWLGSSCGVVVVVVVVDLL